MRRRTFDIVMAAAGLFLDLLANYQARLDAPHFGCRVRPREARAARASARHRESGQHDVDAGEELRPVIQVEHESGCCYAYMAVERSSRRPRRPRDSVPLPTAPDPGGEHHCSPEVRLCPGMFRCRRVALMIRRV
jgi:hypothetical protein